MTDRKTKTATSCVTKKYFALLLKVFSSSVFSLLGCFLVFEPSVENIWKKLGILFEKTDMAGTFSPIIS